MTREELVLENFEELVRSLDASLASYRVWLVGVLRGQDGSISPGLLSLAGVGSQGGGVGHLLLSIDEVAEELGSSASTVKRLIADGKLPAVKLERLTRVRRWDLEDYVAGLAFARGDVA